MAAEVTKLPKWAQEKIIELERRAFVAIRELNEFLDKQTKSAVWFEDWVCTGEETGPSPKRCYVQTHAVTFQLGKAEVDIRLKIDGELHVSYNPEKAEMYPTSYGQLEIKEKK